VPQRATKRSIVAALVMGALVAGSNASAGQAPTRSQGSLPTLVVVTANLNEAFDDKDLRSLKELAPFADRVVTRTPHYPDIMLLQEVRRSSAKYVARKMTGKTGQRYVLATPMGDLPYRATATRWIQRDVAVLLNTETMKPLGRSGLVQTPNPWGVKDKPMYKEHAYTLAKERSTGEKVAALSLHFPPSPGDRSSYPGKFARWTRKVATVMEGKFPAATRFVGGDFNQVSNGAQRPVLENFGYTFILPQDEILGVDHIFTTGTAGFGGADKKGSYSDHRFFWGESFL
jgi:hypothetical protein